MGADIVINYSKDKASAEEALSNIKAMGVKAIAIQADVSNVKRS
jgi:3-oxoacyl-[acyl-carrier protein] reductase